MKRCLLGGDSIAGLIVSFWKCLTYSPTKGLVFFLRFGMVIQIFDFNLFCLTTLISFKIAILEVFCDSAFYKSG